MNEVNELVTNSPNANVRTANCPKVNVQSGAFRLRNATDTDEPRVTGRPAGQYEQPKQCGRGNIDSGRVRIHTLKHVMTKCQCDSGKQD